MERREVLRHRLATQRLVSDGAASAADVVRLLLGVQSQERDHALWSLGMRAGSPSLASVQAELDSGAFVRTHILRQTWHFVAAEDLRWLLALTSPRVEAKEIAYVRKFVPDEREQARALDTMTDALAGRNLLSRKEIGENLGAAGLPGAGEAVGHLIMLAELRGLVCSGPIRGKEHTYGLVDELVAPTPDRTREQALAELARRFYTGHGPASLKDLTRWATLTVADARAAVHEAGDTLVEVDVEGTPHWHGTDPVPAPDPARESRAFLLPVYDEVVLTYPTVNFPAAQGAPTLPGFEQWWGWVVHDGQQAGIWKRTVGRSAVTVETRTAPSLDAASRDAVAVAAEELAGFIGLPAEHVAG